MRYEHGAPQVQSLHLYAIGVTSLNTADHHTHTRKQSVSNKVLHIAPNAPALQKDSQDVNIQTPSPVVTKKSQTRLRF